MNPKHERYDVVFSLGAACACSVALRRAKLQFASFPLDWIAGGTIIQRATLVASHFDGWLEKDDFLYDGRNPVNGLGIFKNKRTGLTHLHDFSDGPIDDSYAKVVEKYRRRESRLFSLCSNACRILCVYVSRPCYPHLSNDDLHKTKHILAQAFPAAKVDLVHFTNDPGRKPSERLALEPEEGIFLFAFDYHDPVRDVNVNAVAEVLIEEGFSAKDFRTDAEKRAYERTLKMKKYGVHTHIGLLAARIKAQLKRIFTRRHRKTCPQQVNV